MGIHIILTSHGLFAQEALNTAGLIIGDIADRVDVISVTPEKTCDMCLAELQNLYEGYADKEAGVLILTDIYGGTPANISSCLAITKPNIKVYSGFNLPVLMELLIARPETLTAAGELIERAFAMSLVDISKKIQEVNENGNQMDSY